MNQNPHVAVVGATGAVGIEMIKTLEKRNFPVGKLTLLASARSVGKKLKFRGEDIPVKELTKDSFAGIDFSLLKGPTEIALTKLLLDFPETIESCAMNFEPHWLTTYLQEVATAFHKFYHEHRIVIPEVDRAKARLALCFATKTVLANGCKILGIEAPERM